MEELILGTLDRYNLCFIVYGQRGSGKTHSLIGDFYVNNIPENKPIINPNIQQADDNIEFQSPLEDRTVKVNCEENGMHLLAAQQLLSIAHNRNEQFQNTFLLTLLEVHDDQALIW